MERPISGAIMHDNAVVTYVLLFSAYTFFSFLQMDNNILKLPRGIYENTAAVGTHLIRKD